MPAYLMDKINEDEINKLRVFEEYVLEMDSSEDEAQFYGFQTIPSSGEDDISNVGKKASSKPKRNRRIISSSESDGIPDIQTPPQLKRNLPRKRMSSSESDGIPDIQTPPQEHVGLYTFFLIEN